MMPKWKTPCYEEREANIELSEELIKLKAENQRLREALKKIIKLESDSGSSTFWVAYEALEQSNERN